jgi:predicted nuclease of predicted toxin-antitoxin system
VKLLVDECLHTSLVDVAHSAGHTADHVAHRGLGGLKDWQLMQVIREQEYTFVTNNRADFLALNGKEPLHAGVIVVVPNVIPLKQRELPQGSPQNRPTGVTSKPANGAGPERVLFLRCSTL